MSHSALAKIGRRAALLLLLAANVSVAGAAISVAAAHLTASAVLTGSMRPAFAPGDAVLTRPIDVQAIRPGMVVLAVPPGQTHAFAHRVRTVSGDPHHPTLTTKGDANPVGDHWTITLTGATARQVIGVIPKLGFLPVAASSPRGRAFALAAFGLVLTIGGVSQVLSLSRITSLHPNPSSPALPAL